MKFDNILKACQKYGSTAADIARLAFQCEPEAITENVILAPVWRPEMFDNFADNVELIVNGSYKIWNLKIGGEKVTFIVTDVGAPNVIDVVLALACTACKEALFIGAVGGLDATYEIGDVVIPDYSIGGDGACRYLTAGQVAGNDCFGEKYFPDQDLQTMVISATERVCSESHVNWHHGRNFSVDTIMGQFAHIDEILRLGATSIEMESAALFKAAEVAAIKAGAIFIVSDNILTHQSLLSGRTVESLQRYREFVRPKVLPNMMLEILQGEIK